MIRKLIKKLLKPIVEELITAMMADAKTYYADTFDGKKPKSSVSVREHHQ